MTCFAARVMQEPLMGNPTIVVITDRNDLDGQLFGVFSLAQPQSNKALLDAAGFGNVRTEELPGATQYDSLYRELLESRPPRSDPDQRA